MRISVSLAILGLVIRHSDPHALLRAFARLDLTTWLTSCALIAAVAIVGTIRWTALLHAYGARHVPSAKRLLTLYFIGFFYNLWAPGGVGGDVVRGIASRDAFGSSGTTASLTVVFVERVAGLIGLFLVVGSAFTLWPLPGIPHPFAFGAVAILAGCLAIAAVAIAPRLAPRLPGLLGRIVSRIPALSRPGPFAVALGLSVLTHVLTALSGHVLVENLNVSAGGESIAVGHSLTAVSLAAVAAFFPFTQAGLGVRESAFDYFFAKVGVASATSVAASLCFLGCQLMVSALGGILSLFNPLLTAAHVDPQADDSGAPR